MSVKFAAFKWTHVSSLLIIWGNVNKWRIHLKLIVILLINLFHVGWLFKWTKGFVSIFHWFDFNVDFNLYKWSSGEKQKNLLQNFDSKFDGLFILTITFFICLK